MSEQLRLNDSVTKLRGVGPAVEADLKKLGATTLADLAELLPFRYEDRRKVRLIRELPYGQDVVIDVEIIKVGTRRSKTGRLIVEAKGRDPSGEIAILWFNQRFILKIAQPGRRLLIYGTRKPAKSMGNPFFAKKIIDRPEMVPIYPATAGLSQYRIVQLIHQLEPVLDQEKDLLPEPTRNSLKLPKKSEALRECHFQQDPDSAAVARRVLAAEELMLMSIKILQAHAQQQKLTGRPIKIDTDYLKELTATLPFQLTDGQRRAAWEILQDFTKPTPMNRLLYGEVGSGKTAVAMLVAGNVIKNGYQVVFLAPTVALADQHYQNLKNFFEPLGIKVVKLIGGPKKVEEADLYIGTHALLEEPGRFKKLGLVIIDEQHRFGVAQRQILVNNQTPPHLLMMTATPIPRSLAQTLFGHLDITYMLGKPIHQKEVASRILGENDRVEVEDDIRARLKRREPGFVICPLIVGEELPRSLLSLERKTIESEEKRLAQEFPRAKIAVLHGRLKNADKEKIVADFRRGGQIDILLSTTVVEVGIDNPQATWILIEEADRFGLAQLHQLRGRVGRGDKKSICYLADSATSPKGRQRLEALVSTTDGIALAEADLRLRGPGELTGIEQSGLPQLKFFDWSEPQLFALIFAEAKKIVNDGLEKHPNIVEAIDAQDQKNETGGA